ncbi:MAG: helix-turn-helix domain-containing protein [Muribaculaceae bacterium]|nr:helix-turn-helix domain-containing protein [Muribaculaceae bacterium]
MPSNIPPKAWNIEKVNNPTQMFAIDSLDSLSEIKKPITNNTIWSVVTISGSLTLQIDDKSLEMAPSTLMVLAPGHLISDISTSDDFSGFAIYSTLSNLSAFLPVMSRVLVCYKVFLGNPVIHIDKNELEDQILYYKLLKKKTAEKDSIPYSEIVVDSICRAIIFETLNLYIKRLDAVEKTTKSTRSEQLFYHFIMMVENRFKKTRVLNDYAEALCISPKHLSALVKEVSGRTAGSWIDAYVIAEAKRLLSSTKMSILEISEELNFANQSFFGKYFKNLTGLSPSQFRNSL